MARVMLFRISSSLFVYPLGLGAIFPKGGNFRWFYPRLLGGLTFVRV